jgi:hypothetical protein
MRKWRRISLISFVLFTIYFSSVAFGMSPMLNTFEETEAEFVKMEIEGSAKIKTEENLKDIVTKLYDGSELGGSYNISLNENEAILIHKDNNKEVKIRAKVAENDKIIYISFLLSHYSQDENIINIRRTVSKSFAQYSVKPSFSSLIVGKYDKEMNMEEMNERADKVFKASGARYIDGIADGKLLSVYGYVPGIQDKVKTMNSYVNLNMAMRYSRADSCTYIWIGSPIIVDEY